MMIEFLQNKRSRFGFGVDIFLPATFILLTISFANSLQEYFVFFKGVHSTHNFILHYCSKLIYYSYFIPMGLLLKYYSKKINFNRDNYFIWITVHLLTLVFILYLHQLLAFTIDRMIFNETYKATFYMVLYTNPSVWADLIIYLFFVLGFFLIDSRNKSRENEINYSKLEVELVKTKLFELRSKIHPQFLFNTLDTISRLIKSNQNKEANKILSKLSEFLRTTVYNSEPEEITLREELIFLTQYIEIEKISFENEIVMVEKIDPGLNNSLIPNFFLQSIIEGLLYENEYKSKSRYELSIHAKQHMSHLLIEIIFIHNEFSATQFLNKSSIMNSAKEQLKQLYGINYSIQVNSDRTEELQIIIELPFHEDFFESEITHLIEETV